MPESTQKKLSRVRPPRVQITYDVEIGDAIQMKELPFVAGILADLSGKPEEALPKLKERKFVEIDRDNFNDVMASSAPRLAFRVDNKLADDDSKLSVELRFQNIDDFNPAEVVKQIEPLRKLFDARQKLMDLLAKLDGNDKLGALLLDVASNPDSQKSLKEAQGGNGAAGA
jgi:type VI secretion system protein ImpB